MRRRFFNNNIKNFDINDYLTIEALEDNLQVYFPYEDLMYGIDGLGWQKLIAGYYSPPINAGQTISFKGNVQSNLLTEKTFTITKRCNLLGNCMSLTSRGIPSFKSLFQNCKTIVSVSKDFLPATTLVANCYYSMFFGCSSLTTAPELPATTLADSCYNYMFKDCSSLTTAPELPATTLAEYCYSAMFLGCSKLNYIKMLATDISAMSCLSSWVYGVSSTGTFVKNPSMTSLPTGIDGIPSGWTVVNNGGE